MAIAEYPDESMLNERRKHDELIGRSLLDAVRQGHLRVRDCRTRFPLKPDAPSVDVLPSLVSINDFREFVAELGYDVQVGDEGEGSASQTVPAARATEAPPAANSNAPGVKETRSERCIRWLAMFEDEAKLGKRGALQRLAQREGVDRSNMSKDIDRARKKRDEEKQAGRWGAQLVKDGKRQH